MTTLRKFFGLLCLILVARAASATTIPLQAVTDDDMKKIAGDLSSNFLHTSVSGANTLGTLWGFEVGLVGAQSSTPNLNDVVHKTDPTADASKLYNAEILGVLSIPFGITGEIGVLPKYTNSGISIDSFNLAAKWTLTETLLSDLPFSLALKAIYSKADVKFSQTISGVPIDYSLGSTTSAGQVLISKNLAIVEPYAGLGFASGTGNLSANATSVFASGSTSASATKSGVMFLGGVELKLLVVKIGAEYANIMGNGRVAGKLSFYF